jgi:DMSO/TMAO reductase YedYZ heme-binding membrane subunit
MEVSEPATVPPSGWPLNWLYRSFRGADTEQGGSVPMTALYFATAAPGARTATRVTSDATLRHMAGILGYTAFFLMSATLCWGMLLGSRIGAHQIRRATLYGGHMTLAILALTTSILHAMVHLFRADQHYDWEKISVPILGGAMPLVTYGIIGLEIVILVAISIWFQRRMSYRRWHRTHWLAYPGFALIALHTIVASKEKTFSLLVALLAGALFAVGVLFLLRLFTPARESGQDRWFDVVEEYHDDTVVR